MTNNEGVRTRPVVLVLENIWSDDLADSTSVRPFLEGWAASLDVRVGFRSYHGRDDFVHWLSEFWSAKSNPWICYIAGHTSGNRLSGLTSNINITQAFSSAIPRKPGPQLDVGPNPKGVLLGTCVVGGMANRLELLESTANSLQWIAGYEKVVPWMESTLCELLFLTYLIQGRCRTKPTASDSEKLEMDENGFCVQKSQSVKKIVEWVHADFPKAKAFGFGADQR